MATAHISAIIVAAGESRRMGQNKLLLPWQGKTVIESIVTALRACTLSEIIVVLGHQAERLREVLQNEPVRCVLNPHFVSGMLSSVQAGVREASRTSDAYLICLGDQPSLNSQMIQPLIKAFIEQKASIIVPSYREKRGHPLLISSQYRDELFKLDPNVGLRQLRLQHADDVFILEIPEAAVLQDLDYPEDYRRALETEKKKG